MAGPPTRYGCYVGNIDNTITVDMLRQLFSQCGTIIDASLNGKDTDAYRYGFVDFANETDRQRAFKLDGVTVGSRDIKVSSSKGNVGKPFGFQSHHQHHHHHHHHHHHQQQQQHSYGHHMHNHYGAPYGMPSPYGGAMGAPAPMQPNPQVAMLMNMIQSGAVNPANLTPEQQQMVAAHAFASAGPPPSMLQGGGGGYAMGGGRGGYGGPHHHHQHHHHHHQPNRGGFNNPRFPSPNPPPSEEMVKLREVQRKQYFDVIRKQAEKYAAKLESKAASRAGDAPQEQRGRSGSADSRSSASSARSAASSGGERDEKRQRKETL